MNLGIDLGTTNTVVAEERDDGTVHVVPLAQLTAAHEQDSLLQLPSYLYAVSPGESVADPWDEAPWVIGSYARRRGLEVPGRLVSSAKSWLSHAGIDRHSACLPWGDQENSEPRLSPVEASAKILEHVGRVCQIGSAGAQLEGKSIVLTVPASFDPGARQLTLEAAARAGLRVRLLEEPMAALYDYLASGGERELTARLREGGAADVLVCDVGGGTTDLSLVHVSLTEAGLVAAERTAVGRHILLGGDNIDLALAHRVEARLSGAEGARLAPGLFAQLVLACRGAKERLLDDGTATEARVVVAKEGSSLVGGTHSATLGRDEVEAVVCQGFLPEVPLTTPTLVRRAGLRGFGLPYEPDPAITRHLAAFLVRHAGGRVPPLVLLNGGVFRSRLLRERLASVYAEWLGQWPTLLEGTDPDVAVARGAVAFARALRGEGIRIGGGAAHGYYVGVQGPAGKPRALCVVPRGAREGERHRVDSHPLALRLGEPVRFELFASDSPNVHVPGELVDVNDELEQLPPLAASFSAEEAGQVEVVLEGELTAIGTLELCCVEGRGSEHQTPRHHRLAFELRGQEMGVGHTRNIKPASGPSARRHKLDEAAELIHRVFGKGRKDVRPREVKDLWQNLERVLGERRGWDVETCRAVFDVIAPKSSARRRTADHERVYFMLVGFCLRPGFGHALDPRRIALVTPLFEQWLSFQDEVRGWQQFWIAWRRLAPGLPEPAQVAMRDQLDPFLAPMEEKLKKPKGVRPAAVPEMLELVSWLERVPAARRAELGRWLLERTWTSRDPGLWRALGRIGARTPVYASAHHVVPLRTVQRWLDHLLREHWHEQPTLARAAVELATMTGDRARDVPDAQRLAVLRRLEEVAVPGPWVERVREVVPLERLDRQDLFGEELPVGLTLFERDA